MADWINAFVTETKTLPSPEPFRLWSAITAVSGVLERKVWTAASAGPIYPGLYTILVGPPASGKTNSIKLIRELWIKIPDLHIAPDNVTKASLVDSLAKSTRAVVNGTSSALSFSALNVSCGEFGVFFPSYDQEFLSVLTSLYDPLPIYVEERRSHGHVEIIRPHIVILAGTQPDYLGSYMPEQAWGQGFASRLLFVYAQSAPVVDLFSPFTYNMSSLVPQFLQLFELKGQFIWTAAAQAATNAWHQAKGPPTPTHNRLQHYVGRRHVHLVKLAMISAASRSLELVVTAEDVERGIDWLLTAERFMPDIFLAMASKSDEQIILDGHMHFYQIWATRPINQRLPIQEKDLWEYFGRRTTSMNVRNVIDVAVKSGYFIPGKYPGEYLPRPLEEVKRQW